MLYMGRKRDCSFIELFDVTQNTSKSVIPSERSESRNLRIIFVAQQIIGAKILRLHLRSAQDDLTGRLLINRHLP